MYEYLIMRRRGQQETEIHLDGEGEPVTIGSGPDNQIILDDPAVLPKHAYIAKVSGHWLVLGYDAKGGIDLTGTLTTPLELTPGFRFAIGSTKFELGGDAASMPQFPGPTFPKEESREETIRKLHAAMERSETELTQVTQAQAEIASQLATTQQLLKTLTEAPPL